jgi:predicted RNA-binding protein YlxR (DUF448 family)
MAKAHRGSSRRTPEAAESGDGNDESGVNPRTCIVTRQPMEAEQLLRFVLAPDGSVVPDIKRRLPGRGVWVELSATAVEKAVRKKLFARAFRTEAIAAPDLAEAVDRLLEREALELLSMCRKAGVLVSGHARIDKALRTGEIALVLHAAEAAEDGMRKLAQGARFCEAMGGEDVAIRQVFSVAAMSLALGMENAMHAAVAHGPLASRVLAAIDRLERYRAGAATGVAAGPKGR